MRCLREVMRLTSDGSALLEPVVVPALVLRVVPALVLAMVGKLERVQRVVLGKVRPDGHCGG
jgi:hypothetical protein